MDRWLKKGKALLQEIRETELGEDELALWFIGQCGFILKYDKTIAMIDPVLNDIQGDDGITVRHYAPPFAAEALKPDYVICTHGHIDHMAGPTVQAIAKSYPETTFIIPAGCAALAEEYGLSANVITGLQDGKTVSFIGHSLEVRAVSAAHPNHVLSPADPDMALGYLLELGGIRILHLGDTYLTERLLQELEALPAPNIFLPPINGDDRFRAMRNCIGNMEAEESAKLAIHLGADLSIPTHYDMIKNNTVDPLRFAAELRREKPTAKWHIPALGERVIYKK